MLSEAFYGRRGRPLGPLHSVSLLDVRVRVEFPFDVPRLVFEWAGRSGREVSQRGGPGSRKDTGGKPFEATTPVPTRELESVVL